MAQQAHSRIAEGLPSRGADCGTGVVISRFTRLGRFTYAIGNNEQIARDNGVPVARYKAYVFLIAAAAVPWPV